jgi:hypothetical protein
MVHIRLWLTRPVDLNGTRFSWEIFEASDVQRGLSYAVLHIKEFRGTVLDKNFNDGGIRVLDCNV